MSWALGLDAASSPSEVCLYNLKDGQALEGQIAKADSTDRDLAGVLRDLLESTKARPEDLEFVVVGSGPGSFTGLRIAYSLAKGLVFNSKITLTQQATFEAWSFSLHDQACLCLMEAGRGELFSAFWQQGKNVWLPVIETLPTCLSKIVGLGLDPKKLTVLATADLIKSAQLVQHFEEKNILSPSSVAKKLILLTLAKGQHKGLQKTQDLAEISPNYLRAVSAKTIQERAINPR